MDYRFPKRVIRITDFPIRRHLNDDFIPITEKLAGSVRSHNISRDAVTSISPDYYYTPYWAVKSVNPGWGSGAMPTNPAPADAVAVRESMAWQPISDMTHNITTSLGFLWINMWCQYLWPNWTAIRPSLFGGWWGSQIQMAIRVDGRIIEGTIPGSRDVWGRPPIPMKVNGGSKRRTAEIEGMFRRNSNTMLGSGPNATPLRCSAVVPVGPGTHTIEMVVRRLPATIDRANPFGATAYIYSRTNLVLDCHQTPKDDSGPYAYASTTPYAAGDVLSASSLGAQRDIIKTAVNDLMPGNIARGALQNQHMGAGTGAAIDKAATEVIDGPVTYVKSYPGYVTGPISAAPAGAGVSWTWVQDIAAALLKTSSTHAAAWGATKKSLFLILANVRMHEVYPVGVGADDDSFNSIAAFALTSKQAGVDTVLTQSIGYVNGFGGTYSDGVGNRHIDEEWDVPLMALIEADAGLLNPYQDFGVVTASFGTVAGAREVVTGGAAIQVIQLRKE